MSYYVYALLDPRSDEVFYIGKGKGARVAAHKKEAADAGNNAPKHQRIREIERAGETVRQIYLVKDIENEDEAYSLEALMIYEAMCHNVVLGLDCSLTNLASGQHTERYRPWASPHEVSGFEYEPTKLNIMAFHEECRPLFEYVIKEISEFKNSTITTQPYIRGKKHPEKHGFHFVLWPKNGSLVTFEYISLAAKPEIMKLTQQHANQLKEMLDLDSEYKHAKLDTWRPDLDIQDHAAVAGALQEFIDMINQAEADLGVTAL